MVERDLRARSAGKWWGMARHGRAGTRSEIAFHLELHGRRHAPRARPPSPRPLSRCPYGHPRDTLRPMNADAEAIRILTASIPDVIAVYRFGSSADGTALPTSDVDLAFLAHHALDPVRRFELQEQLALALRRNVDLVDLRAASTVMRMQVLSRGLVLAAPRAGEQARFESYVYASYARLNEERKAILEQVRREGTVYGR
jgi:predicted nucleotidyltransferase